MTSRDPRWLYFSFFIITRSLDSIWVPYWVPLEAFEIWPSDPQILKIWPQNLEIWPQKFFSTFFIVNWIWSSSLAWNLRFSTIFGHLSQFNVYFGLFWRLNDVTWPQMTHFWIFWNHEVISFNLSTILGTLWAFWNLTPQTPQIFEKWPQKIFFYFEKKIC